jgi:molybdopterin-guanine dinucleotide biosynthesis protein A
MIEPPPAYILAGGRSARFGSDKARAELAGEPLVARVARMIEPHVADVTIVADVPGKYDDLGLRTIADRIPDRGPLGGLDAAISDCIARAGPSRRWLLLASCDLVELRGSWIEALREGAGESVCIVVYRGERWHPMPGLYRVDLAEDVARRLESRQLAMRSLIEASPHRALSLPSDWPALAQVNTREQLEEARRKLASEHGDDHPPQ